MKHNGIQDPSAVAQNDFPTSQRIGFAAGTLPTQPAIAPPLRLPPPKLPGSPQTQPREYTRPTYAERFRCIGSACEDTCCQGWGVPIDQTTYEKYRSTDFLKAHLGTLIQLNTSNPTTSDYARIPLTIQSVCPFLDAERLCGIQKQLGGLLSDLCDDLRDVVRIFVRIFVRRVVVELATEASVDDSLLQTYIGTGSELSRFPDGTHYEKAPLLE
jgi:hypothetical protein